MRELQKFIEVAQGAKFLGSVVFPLNPVPASRPKMTRYSVYYGKKHTTWKKFVEENIPSGNLYLDAKQDLLVTVTNVVQKPKTSKKSIPHGDVDNFCKLALDGVTSIKGYWYDDAQIEILMGWKRFAEPGEEPGTVIEIYSP